MANSNQIPGTPQFLKGVPDGFFHGRRELVGNTLLSTRSRQAPGNTDISLLIDIRIDL